MRNFNPKSRFNLDIFVDQWIKNTEKHKYPEWHWKFGFKNQFSRWQQNRWNMYDWGKPAFYKKKVLKDTSLDIFNVKDKIHEITKKN